ncbi:MAG: retroviral-like aspartic protease family protein [Kiritimatiellae bacterium]|nr:retroviral-like aspartic protease family protein [Kiritimatiellia bacterium]MBQ6328739.1 retroviral-like aspartic protease family protein [Kiritimatiellia bacterium]
MKIEPVVENYDKIVRDIQSNLVVVGSGERISGNRTPVVVKAIWDTGAYGSVISPRVAEELGLMPVGVKPIQTANGTYEAYAYVVDVMLPNKLVIRGVEVSESDLKVCDALIGMDIISMGDMKITNKPTTKFIFRIPAEGDTPLVAG